jgi:hypothetical protein
MMNCLPAEGSMNGMIPAAVALAMFGSLVIACQDQSSESWDTIPTDIGPSEASCVLVCQHAQRECGQAEGCNCGECQGDLTCETDFQGLSQCVDVDARCDFYCKPSKCTVTNLATDGGNGVCVCKSCPEGQVCLDDPAGAVCCRPDCTDRACGDDGCGGNCGDCPEGWDCEASWFGESWNGAHCRPGPGCRDYCDGVGCGWGWESDCWCGDCPEGQTCEEGDAGQRECMNVEEHCAYLCEGAECGGVNDLNFNFGDGYCPCGDCPDGKDCVGWLCEDPGR